MHIPYQVKNRELPCFKNKSFDSEKIYYYCANNVCQTPVYDINQIGI